MDTQKAIDEKRQGPSHARNPLSRRGFLTGTTSAAFGIAGLRSAAAQVWGTSREGGTVPFRLPLGALDHLDRNQYIHNMEIHAHLSGATANGGEPFGSMWAKGAQRLLVGGTGFVDVSDPRKPFVMSRNVFQGGLGNVVYNSRLKKWIVTTAAQVPLTDPNPNYPRGKYHAEYAARSTGYKGLRGLRNYDATDPAKPQLLQEFSTGETGSGTHMNFYDGGRYAFLDCGWDNQLRQESSERPYSNALMVVDMSDPAHVKEVSRWWAPGQLLSEEERYKQYPFAGDQSSWTGNHGGSSVPVRIEDGGRYGYTGMGVFGMYVHDFSDPAHPKVVGHVSNPIEGMGGIPFHTCYPVIADAAHPQLQDKVIAVFESLEADCREPFHTSYVVDVKDPAAPRIIGLFPRPTAPEGAPYADFCQARGRFSSHNMQSWIAPGKMRPEIVVLSYFNAGIRLYDISDPAEPKEVAYFVPPRDGEIENFATWRRGTSENVFIEWDRNLIWLSTHAGVYCLSSPALGAPVLEPRRISEWTAPHLNAGWDG